MTLSVSLWFMQAVLLSLSLSLSIPHSLQTNPLLLLTFLPSIFLHLRCEIQVQLSSFVLVDSYVKVLKLYRQDFNMKLHCSLIC